MLVKIIHDYTLSLRGAPVGGEYNALEWDGSTLTLRGALRQTAAGVIEPSLRGNLGKWYNILPTRFSSVLR